MNRNDRIAQWAAEKASREYGNDVSLLLTYGSYENGTMNALSDVDFYFIPRTDRGYELCMTFIVEGIGYDLFPMSWERVAGLAEMRESLTPCLANVKILYCHSQEDRERFAGLQRRLQDNLADRTFMQRRAQGKLKEAIEKYGLLQFADIPCDRKGLAASILMVLADAVAFANQTYFARGLKGQLEDLRTLRSLPVDFIGLYESVVRCGDGEEADLCRRMIENVGVYLAGLGDGMPGQKPNGRELAEFYEEAISTWNKITVCCEAGNADLAFLSGACLQRELDAVAHNSGLQRLDVMGGFDADDLASFQRRAEAAQVEFLQQIEACGGKLRTYSDVEAFLKADEAGHHGT